MCPLVHTDVVAHEGGFGAVHESLDTRDADGSGGGGGWVSAGERVHEKLNGAEMAKLGQSLIVRRISDQSADKHTPRIYRRYFRLR